MCYLDGNSLGRLPLHTLDVMSDFLVNGWGAKVVDGWSDWIDLAQTAGDLIGRATLGAAPGQVIAQDTTSINFYRACRAAITARPGRRTIITDTANFPTDRYILEGIAAELDLNLVMIENEITSTNLGVQDERVTPEILEPFLNDDVALVSLSVVAYRSGALHDIKAITDAARAHGALVVWDASHAVGCVDLQFDRDGVDLAVGCTYKYGNSGPGAPAWLYINSSIQSSLDAPIHGWFAQRDQFAMGQGFSQVAGMRGFQIASPSIMGLLCVMSAFSMIEQAGIAAINAKASRGTDLMIELYDQWLVDLGYTLVTPRDAAARGGHIVIHHSEAPRISRGLRLHKNVVPDFREPNGIRLSMSPLPTSYIEVYEGFKRLRDYTASGDYTTVRLENSQVT
ncbi:MAG: aminotransferase class V-fold PLP-dependent enzyme [Actinobacteria bacterium]|nr:aminotransferase class V-fold PLP-dependent enzyme [Actinomycetota bacterium]